MNGRGFQCSAMCIHVTLCNLPFYCVVISNSEFTRDDDIVKVNVLTHRPKFKTNGLNGGQAEIWSLIFEEVWIVNLTRCPLALHMG